MRAVLQRVSRAEVRVADEAIAAIGPGLVVLLGVGPRDDEAAADALAKQVAELRIFRDDSGRTNRAVTDVRGEVLVVSQFTLFADTSRGRRPGFTGAAPADLAERLYERFAATLAATGLPVRRGRFGAEMAVELVNDGPFTIVLDTEVRGNPGNDPMPAPEATA